MELNNTLHGGATARAAAMSLRSSRVALFCITALAGVQLTVAPLPDAAEYSRATGCIQINNFIDFTAPASASEELPPCVAACPPGTEAVVNQCVWPSHGTEELRLRFELFERCQAPSCEWFGQWQMHLNVVSMKLAHFLSIPLQELREAMIFWSTSEWPAPEGSPRLQKFLIARRGEDDFPLRRTSSASSDKWYLLHMTFRVDSSRISRWSRPVRQLTEGESGSSSLSAYLGIPVEVRSPEAQMHERSAGQTFSHSDYQLVYKFEGFAENQNPFSGSTTQQAQVQGNCRDPCYYVDEEAHLLGAHRCQTTCECVGARVCSDFGYCVGARGVCSSSSQGSSGTPNQNAEDPTRASTTTRTTTVTPIRIPGYYCIQRTHGVADASGASIPMTTLRGCTRECSRAPTCRGLEWRAPDYCFLITRSLGSSALLGSSQDGTWFVCSRLFDPPPMTSTTARTSTSTTTVVTTTLALPNTGLRTSHAHQEKASAVEAVSDAPGWHLWLAAFGVPALCCAALAMRFTICRKPKIVPTADKVDARRSRSINSARGWAMATDSQGAAGDLPPTMSAFGYSETVKRESWPRTTATPTSSPPAERAKSWYEGGRRTRPLFAEDDIPRPVPPPPKRHRSAPPGSSVFVDAGDMSTAGTTGAGSPSGPSPHPHFSAAWEGSYGRSSSRDDFTAQPGPRSAADAAADESGAPAGSRPSRHRSSKSFGAVAEASASDAAGAADASTRATASDRRATPPKGRQRSKSAEEGDPGDSEGRRRSSSASSAGPTSGRVKSPPTPPPPPTSGSQPTRVTQLAEEAEKNESNTALSPVALALELAKLRESTLAERRRYFMAQCLRWHPDKNAGDEQHATRMFQVLQEKKEWFLSDS